MKAQRKESSSILIVDDSPLPRECLRRALEVHGAVIEEAEDGDVALKIVHPNLLATPGFFKRFLREAEVGKIVRHKNVVRTLDSGEYEGLPYLVMEFVQGRSLEELLDEAVQGGKVPPVAAKTGLGWMRQLAEALKQRPTLRRQRLTTM